MKKKVIVPIVLSSVALLLGGLIYFGISSNPQLLESEKSIKKEADAPIFVDDTIVVEEDKLFAPKAVEATPSLGGGSDYIPSSVSGDVTYIDAPSSASESKASVSTSKPSFKESAIFDIHPLFHEENNHESFGSFVISTESSVEQPVVSNEHVSYSSSIEKADDSVHQEIVKTKKTRVNKNKSIRSNEALIETTLLVIGAVDIFSMILIHRRKHLFR